MPDSLPSQPVQLPGNRNDYAPIAFAAVAAAACAFLFVALIVVIGLMALLTGKTLQEPKLLILPVITVVLAFIARRQIRASEGARTGEYWANLAWTVAVVGGALLIAYLLAIQFAVRREATAAFTLFSEPLLKSDPANPLDPELAAATYYTLSPGQQTVIGKPSNAPVIRSTQSDALARLRGSDLGLLVARNKGEVKIIPGSLVESRDVGPRIESLMAATVESPEGTASIVVPLIGESQEGQPRRWHVGPPAASGYIVPGSRRLTPYGWGVELLGQSAQRTVQGIVSLQSQAQVELLYEAFVKPGGDAQTSAKRVAERATAALPLVALVGNAAGVPLPPPEMTAAIDKLFADLDGNAASGPQLERFRALFLTPGRIAAGGAQFKDNPEKSPLILADANKLTALIPMEFVLSEGSQPPIATGRGILEVSGERGQTLATELAKLKTAGGPTTDRPTAEFIEKYASSPVWKLIRVQSDLKPNPAAQPRQVAPRGMEGG